MKVFIRNRTREYWPNYYVYLLPLHRRRHIPGRWVDAKGNSAMLAKIIRCFNLATGNRVTAKYIAEFINIRHERVEWAPAFKYRGKARRLFIPNARIRYPHSLARSSPSFDHDL